jgi:rhomboid protease GluP
LVSVVFISILFIIGHIFWNDYGKIAERLVASGNLVFAKGQWYRDFTSIFIHADLGHLLSNSYMLFFLIYLNYAYFAPCFSISCCDLSALINHIVRTITQKLPYSLGLIYHWVDVGFPLSS